MRHPDAVRREDPLHSLCSRGRPWHALYKDCNAALANLGRSLRASQEAVMPKAFASLMGQALCVVVLP